MKSSSQLTLVICVLLSGLLFAQEPKLKITEAFVSAGFSNGQIMNSSHSDFQILAPNSMILENHPEALNSSSMFFSPYRSSGGFSIQTGIQFFNKEKNELRKTPTLRLGLKYGRVNQFNNWSSTYERSPYDTLVGQNTGNVYYLDSVKSTSVNGNYQYEQISFDASIIFRTNQDLRWSIYGGIGMSLGISINAKTTLSLNETNYTELRGNSSSSAYFSLFGEGMVRESHLNKSAIGGALYVPLGLDFRLGDKSSFWSMIHLFAEAQPGIGFQNVPELNRTVTQSYLFLNSGVRIRW